MPYGLLWVIIVIACVRSMRTSRTHLSTSCFTLATVVQYHFDLVLLIAFRPLNSANHPSIFLAIQYLVPFLLFYGCDSVFDDTATGQYIWLDRWHVVHIPKCYSYISCVDHQLPNGRCRCWWTDCKAPNWSLLFLQRPKRSPNYFQYVSRRHYPWSSPRKHVAC